jgi:peptidoglycan/LPS O-acetylase OafA/YrhL
LRPQGGKSRPSTQANAVVSSISPVRAGFLGRIESVRGLAALCVALNHVLGYMLVNEGWDRALFDQQTVRDVVLMLICGSLNGETAVMVFFVISGVVIGRSLDGRGDGFVSFMIRRLLRLYPAHIAATVGIIGLALLFLVGQPPVDFSGFSGTYPALSEDGAAWLNGAVFDGLTWKSVAGNLSMANWTMNLVVWSLYAEVCAAPFLPLFHRLSRRSSALVDGIVLGSLLSLSLLNWGHLWSRYLFIFYLGMMVETRGVVWMGALERLVGGKRAAVALLYLVMVLPTMLTADRRPIVVLIEAAAAFGIISVIVRSEGQAPFRSLERPVLRWNGRLSYSFYLWHFFIATIAIREVFALLTPQTMRALEIPIALLTIIVTVLLALVVAQYSYRYVELPSIALGRNLAARWRRLKRPPDLAAGRPV